MTCVPGPHTNILVNFDVGAVVRGGQRLCQLTEVAPFFVVIGQQCIVSLNKELTEVKHNTLVNDEPSVEVSAYCADIPHERPVPSVVEMLSYQSSRISNNCSIANQYFQQPPDNSSNMSYNVHTATTQSYDLASSLLNTPFVPAAEAQAPRSRRNRPKKYPCSWQGCDRFFDCRHNVQQHIREAHTLEKPYECDFCTAEGVFSAFSRQYGLNRHMRQVHSVNNQPSKAMSSSSASHSAAPQWTNRSQLLENDKFTETGAMLAQAKFEVGAVSSDVEMADSQFQFDAELSDMDISGEQLFFSCDQCGHTSAIEEDIFTHMHALHNFPNTQFCSCRICTLMFKPSKEDAMNHEILLGNGAFHLPSDAASFAQDGPNVTIAPAWSSQLGPGDAAGWDNIDPALLS